MAFPRIELVYLSIVLHASALDSARSLFVSISRLEMAFFRSIHDLPELNAEACCFMSIGKKTKMTIENEINPTTPKGYVSPSPINMVESFTEILPKINKGLHQNDVSPCFIWRPQGDSNPCRRRERAVS